MDLIGYLRVSTERQVREGHGLDAQRTEITRWAQAEGHQIVAWATDEGISGTRGITARQGLYDAITAVEDGQAAGVVMTSLDRLARLLTEQEGILAQVWAKGGRAFALGDGGEVLEDDPDDPMRTAVRQIRGVFAQLERGLIRQRMLKGKREKANSGGYTGGGPALGWQAVGHELVTDEDEQAIRSRVVELRSAGLSLRDTIRSLDDEGCRPKRGGRWHPTTITRIESTTPDLPAPGGGMRRRSG